MVASRERLVSSRLAWTLATRPRPKREARGALILPLAADMTACLLGGGERLGDERFCVLDLTRADAAWPDAEVILAGHGRMSREV